MRRLLEDLTLAQRQFPPHSLLFCVFYLPVDNRNCTAILASVGFSNLAKHYLFEYIDTALIRANRSAHAVPSLTPSLSLQRKGFVSGGATPARLASRDQSRQAAYERVRSESEA